MDKYIEQKYKNEHWFVEEVQSISNQLRISNVMQMKDYLSGQHKIMKKESYIFNGKVFEPRKIVLNQAHTIINFMTSFLLGNNITITGQESIVDQYVKVSRKAKYDRLNYKILDRTLKFGEVYEYLFLSNGVIKSKLIDPSEGTPVFNENNELVALIESYNFDGIDYYIVYEEDVVSKYNNEGGNLFLSDRYPNLSGLPIIYHTDNEYSETQGISELSKWVDILDNMEDLISKAVDGYYKHITGIPVSIGQQLKDSLPTDIVGAGLALDDGGSFEYVSNKFDSPAFKTLYDTLVNSLYEVASIPSITMGRTDISNVSTESIKILYSLAIMKSEKNAQFMKEGLEQRFEKMRKLMEYTGVTFSDDQYDSLGVNFQYALPTTNTEIIKDMQMLREMGGLSLESLLENSPYTSDVNVEKERIANEGKGNLLDDK